jgi:hypothetical protein
MFVTPFIFSDKIKEEIKKTANKKLAGEMNYSDVNVSFFKHFPSLTLSLNDFKLNGSAPNIKGRLKGNMKPEYPSLVGDGVVFVKHIKMHGMKMFSAVAKKTSKEEIKNPELSKVEIKSSIKNNIIPLERFKFKFAGFRTRIEEKQV